MVAPSLDEHRSEDLSNLCHEKRPAMTLIASTPR
jgi:hypothetical protein